MPLVPVSWFPYHFRDHIRISTSCRISSRCKAEVAAWNCFHLNFSSTSRWVWLSDDIYTSDWCCARGAPVYLISDETNRIGGCATRNGRCGKGRKKKRKGERKGKERKRGNLHNRFRARQIRPRNSSPAHRLFVYIGFSISIYNTPSPHAVAAAGRKSYRAENSFSWEMWRARYTRTILPIR